MDSPDLPGPMYKQGEPVCFAKHHRALARLDGVGSPSNITGFGLVIVIGCKLTLHLVMYTVLCGDTTSLSARTCGKSGTSCDGFSSKFTQARQESALLGGTGNCTIN